MKFFNQKNSVTPILTSVLSIGLCAVSVSAVAMCIPAPNGLVGWWSGDDNAEDLSGNMLHGMGGKFTDGRFGSAFEIRGDEANVVKIPQNTLLEPSAVTVDAWVRHDGVPSNFQWFVAKGASGCDSASYGLYYSPFAGETRMIIFGQDNSFGVAGFPTHVVDGGGSVVPNNPDIYDGEWHFIAGTYDPTEGSVRLYVDGIEVKSVAYNKAIQYSLSPDNNLLIGDYNNNGNSCGNSGNFAFVGDIDEVEIFSRALSANEINDLYVYGKCKFLTVAVDIKPGSDPNCFNVNGHGVIPVAILGTEDFDVSDIDDSTLSFNGLSVRVRGKGPLCHQSDVNEDGISDLVCQFEDDVELWDEGASIGLISGKLFDGTVIKGEDTICIKPR